MVETWELESLLSRQEGPALGFKRAWYKLQDGSQEARGRQKHELIKDVLSLANGNMTTAREVAYLIVGAADRPDDNGHRRIYNVGSSVLPAKDILQIVDSACEPPLEDLYCEMVDYP